MYDSMSHCTPGYWFQYHVPPKSAPFSMMRMRLDAERRATAPREQAAEAAADDRHVDVVA